jgi:hypothetical protein
MQCRRAEFENRERPAPSRFVTMRADDEIAASSSGSAVSVSVCAHNEIVFAVFRDVAQRVFWGRLASPVCNACLRIAWFAAKSLPTVEVTVKDNAVSRVRKSLKLMLET